METKAPTMTAADAAEILRKAYPYGDPAGYEPDAAALADLWNGARGNEFRALLSVKLGPFPSAVYLDMRRFMSATARAAGLNAGRWVSMADRLPEVWPRRFQ